MKKNLLVIGILLLAVFNSYSMHRDGNNFATRIDNLVAEIDESGISSIKKSVYRRALQNSYQNSTQQVIINNFVQDDRRAVNAQEEFDDINGAFRQELRQIKTNRLIVCGGLFCAILYFVNRIRSKQADTELEKSE